MYYFDIVRQVPSTSIYTAGHTETAVSRKAFDAASFECLHGPTIPRGRWILKHALRRNMGNLWAYANKRSIAWCSSSVIFNSARPEGKFRSVALAGRLRALPAIFSPRSYFREVTEPAAFAAHGNHEAPARTSSRWATSLCARTSGGRQSDEGRKMKRVQLYGVLFLHTPLYSFLINRETRRRGRPRNRG